MRRWLHVLLAVLGALVLGVLLAPPASAHTVLVGSDPADGSRLTQSPASVTLRFNEQVGLQLGYLRVVDSGGRRVDKGSPTHPDGNGSSVTVALRPGLGDGSYLASFRVISADSHPVAGSIRYVVGDGPLDLGTGTSGSAPVDRAVSTGLAVSHWLSFAGVGMVGGSWLVFTLWPAGSYRRSIRRLVWAGWGLAAAGAVTEYLLEGPYGAGTGLSTLADTGLLDASLHGNAGQLLSLRVLLLGVLGMVLASLFDGDPRRRPSGGPGAAATVGAAIVVTFAATGHTQSASPRWLWVLVDALHLSAMIIWLGGLVVLLTAALSRAGSDAVVFERAGSGGDALDGSASDGSASDESASDESASDGSASDGSASDGSASDGAGLVGADADRAQLAAGLPIFSRIAMVCIATLAVTGTLQAWREVGALDALTTTQYGRLVLLKVALFVAVLGLGYLARRAVQRRNVPVTAKAPVAENVPVTASAMSAATTATMSGATATATTGATTASTSEATAAAPTGATTATTSEATTARWGSGLGLPSGLGRTLLCEVGIGALVLAATGVLVFQPPGKVALAAERSKPRHATVQVSAVTRASVDVAPGVHGNVRIAVRLSGGPRPIGVTATASLPSQQLGPIPVALQASGPASYVSNDVLLPVAGVWELTLTVQTSEFDSTVAVARVKVS